MEKRLTTIDPNQSSIPDTATIQKVVSENDRLPNGEHEKAVKAFYFSDSIASGIGKDFAFVEKIPQLISDIIDNKSWECLYVSRGVVTPYYCRYTKGTDSENFRAFIAAKRPNGLGTTIETIYRLLEAELEIQRKFRAIIYESRQGERTDLDNGTSRLKGGKLDELSNRQQERVRASERAAEAIPEIGELLDRGLIAIDVAAKLGRDIKDSDNLTAEEREYVDKRDLVGLRIKSYIDTNTIPEDEDKEPAYSRKLNEFVKDLLGIKNRSKTVRMDNPKKAAEKLLKFYEGKKLKELVEYLSLGLTDNKEDADSQGNIRNSHFLGSNGAQSPRPTSKREAQLQQSTKQTMGQMPRNDVASEGDSIDLKSDFLSTETKNLISSNNENNSSGKIELKNNNIPQQVSFLSKQEPPNQKEKVTEEQATQGSRDFKSTQHGSVAQGSNVSSQLVSSSNSKQKNIFDQGLTQNELAERFNLKSSTIADVLQKRRHKFTQWSQSKDPENIGWTRTEEKRGRSFLFTPVQKNKEEVK